MIKRIIILLILIGLLILLLPLSKKGVKLGDYTITSVVNTPSNQIANLILANHWPSLQTFNGGISTTYINATSTTATSTFSGGIVGPNNFTVQQSSGNVGVATSSPYSKLSVNGKTVTTVLRVDTFIESQNLYLNSAGGLSFSSSDYSTPYVEMYSEASDLLKVLTATNGVDIGLDFSRPTSSYTVSFPNIAQNGEFVISTSTTQVSSINATSTTDYSYFAKGIGIGTTTPGTNLQVNGTTATSTISATVVNGSTRSTTIGGNIILQDISGGTCTEIATQSGVVISKAIACP